jgi:hypothetical protein
MPKVSDNGPPGGDVIHIVDPNLRHGFAQVPRPILRACGLSDKAKIVYALLLDYAWQDGSCFPGQEKLAEDLATSDRTIRRALDELKATKLITWKQRGLSQTNVYYILNIAESRVWPAEERPAEPDRTKMSGQDRSNLSTPKRTKTSTPDRTAMSDKQYPSDYTQDEEYSVPATSPAVSDSRGLSPSNFEGARAQENAEGEDGADDTDAALEPPPRQRGLERLASMFQRSSLAREVQQAPPPAPDSGGREQGRGGKPRHRPAQETALRQAIRPYLEEYAEELGDEAPLSSTITQAVHLFERSGFTIDGFIGQMQQAHRETLRRSGSIKKQRARGGPGPAKNKMPFYFAILQDYLGLKELPEGAESIPPTETYLPEPPPPVARRRKSIGGPLVRVGKPRHDDFEPPPPNASFSGPRSPSDGLEAPSR